MRLALVGVGGAGGRVVDRMRRTEKRIGETVSHGHVLVFDTDRESLDDLDTIPAEKRVPFGQTLEAARRGVDGDPELGARVVEEDDHEIHRTFDDVPVEDLDGILLVAGLAGGTGGGAGAAMIAMFQELFEFPIYAVGVLPREDADEQASLTAARSLQSFVRHAENVIAFDNETWVSGDSYATSNEELADRLVRLLALGEFDGAPAESRVDRTDLIRTLSTGGISTIGKATWGLDLGWRRWVRWLPWVGVPPRDASADAVELQNVVQRATESLTIPCDVSSTERGLVVTAGPSAVLSRKGFESARHWLEGEVSTVELIAGDEPRPSHDAVTAIVLLSNVTEVPRIESLKERGVAALVSE